MTKKETIKKAAYRKAPRKCSVCGKNGHNTRTCTTKKKRIQKSKNISSFIPVQVVHEAHASPHLVELQKKKANIHWQGVEVYRERKNLSASRQLVDFASLVRSANTKKQDIQKEPTTVESKNISSSGIDILAEIAHIKSQSEGVNTTHTVSARKALNLLTARHRFGVGTYQKIQHVLEDWQEHMHDAVTNFRSHFSIRRFSISIIGLLLVVGLPFPVVGYYHKIQSDTARIVGESTNAFLSLQSSTVAAFQNNLPQAEYDLNIALNSFGNAQEIIDREYKALAYVASILPIVGDKVKSRQELLLAGHHLALGNTYLVKGIDEATRTLDIDLIERLTLLRQHVRSALPQYNSALDSLDNVDSLAIPAEYQESFKDFKNLFAGFIHDMEDVDNVVQGVQLIMGGEGFKRYLILFQNNYELRPTGGFVGSFAVMDVQDGKILDISVPGGGSYDLQGQLDVFVKPPLPLQLLNGRWEFQDGNWFPDFPASAQKMAWFYRHSRNTTVDGVIAVNAHVLERLLDVMGPIHNDQYELMLNADDALSKLRYEIESYDGEENTPKAVLSVLLNQLIENIGQIEPQQLLSLVSETHEALIQKDIQFYFVDERVENVFKEYGWTGEILDTASDQDYLMVVNSNLGGGKSDANVSQHVFHQAVVQDDGSIVDTVLVTRYYPGDASESSDEEINSSYLRLYVPEGSELLDAGGFVYPDEASFRVPPRSYTTDIDLSNVEQEESIHVGTGTRITHEFGKTAFGNWIVTRPGHETQVYFIYKIPFNVFRDAQIEEEDSSEIASLIDTFGGKEDFSRYSVVLQRQSGSRSNFEHAIIYPEGWKPVWKVGDALELSANGAAAQGPLETDEVFGIIMKQE